MGSHTGQYGNLSTVSSTRAGTDITLPLIDGELSQPSSTIREMLEETCSGKIFYSKVTPKSSQSHPKLIQSHPKVISKSFQSHPKAILKLS